MVHEQMHNFFRGFRRDAHPMAIDGRRGRRDVGVLSRQHRHQRSVAARGRVDPPDREAADDRGDGLQVLRSASRSCIRATISTTRRTSCNMCFSVPAEEYDVDPILARAMDRIFTLHADHEQNASTSTVRLASSSGANPFACIAAGIACLWGPAHGGANQAALEMLREIGTRGPHPRVHRPGQGQGRSVPPDGLRAPGLQELRPARDGDEGKRRRGARPAWASRTTRPCRSPRSWRSRRWRIRTSPRRSCSRTSISTRASSSRRWASRPRCSRRSSRCRGRSAGSRSGRSSCRDPALKIGRPRQLYTGADAARLRRRREPLSDRPRCSDAARCGGVHPGCACTDAGRRNARRAAAARSAGRSCPTARTSPCASPRPPGPRGSSRPAAPRPPAPARARAVPPTPGRGRPGPVMAAARPHLPASARGQEPLPVLTDAGAHLRALEILAQALPGDDEVHRQERLAVTVLLARERSER